MTFHRLDSNSGSMSYMAKDFVERLLEEMEARGYSMRELARRSGGTISVGLVSLVLSEKQPPSEQFCVGVAKALGLRADTVLAWAGHRAPPPAETERLSLQRIWWSLQDLDEDELDEIERYIRYIAEERRARMPDRSAPEPSAS